MVTSLSIDVCQCCYSQQSTPVSKIGLVHVLSCLFTFIYILRCNHLPRQSQEFFYSSVCTLKSPKEAEISVPVCHPLETDLISLECSLAVGTLRFSMLFNVQPRWRASVLQQAFKITHLFFSLLICIMLKLLLPYIKLVLNKYILFSNFFKSYVLMSSLPLTELMGNMMDSVFCL